MHTRNKRLVRKRRTVFVIMLLTFGMLSSACQKSSSSRVLETVPIDTSVKDDSQVQVTESETTDMSFEQTEYSVSLEDLPFELIIDDDLLIVDHGKQTASVYRAVSGDTPDAGDVSDAWFRSAVKIDWCVGVPIWPEKIGSEEKESVIEHDLALQNMGNVREISLSDIHDASGLPLEKCNASGAETVLAWNYSMEGFPIEFFEGTEDYRVFQDVSQVQYIPIATFQDGIPLSAGATHDFFTVEWDGVIQPAGCGFLAEWGKTCINADNQFAAIVGKTYEISETILSDQPIIPAEECLDQIGRALAYDTSKTKGKTVEVYCMELRYFTADEYPLWVEDGIREAVLIPVWQVYMKVYSKNSVEHCKTMINAITGQSVFSDTIGPADMRYYSYFLQPEG